MGSATEEAILASSFVNRRADLLAAEVDGEVMLMGIAQGRLFGLDAMGSIIWRRLAARCRVGDLCAELARTYDADPATIEADLLAFLTTLRAQGFVEVTADEGR